MSTHHVTVTETHLETGGILSMNRAPLHPRARRPLGKPSSPSTNNRRGWSTCFILCSGYKSCVCRQQRRPDGKRIMRFINGGLKSRLHGVKGACKQLNVGKSKVVFGQGDRGQVGMVKHANTTAQRGGKHLPLIVFELFCYCLSVFAYLDYIPVKAG